jgi:hypothetical protein
MAAEVREGIDGNARVRFAQARSIAEGEERVLGEMELW